MTKIAQLDGPSSFEDVKKPNRAFPKDKPRPSSLSANDKESPTAIGSQDSSCFEYRPYIGEINECLNAGPTFRSGLGVLEAETFEAQKWISEMLEVVDDYCTNNQLMTRILQVLGSQLTEMSPSVLETPEMREAMGKFGASLKEQGANQEILNLQIEDGFKNRLASFFGKEFGDLREKKARFHHSDKKLDKTAQQYSLDSAVRMNRDLPTKFYQDQKEFHKETLNYMGKLEAIESQKTSVILENCLSFMYAQRSYFCKGYEMFNDLEPYMRALASALHSSQANAAEMEKRLKNKRTYAEAEAEIFFGRHLRVRRTMQDSTSFGTSKSGNLFVRVARRIPTWEKAFFYVQKGMIMYHEYSATKQAKYSAPIIAADLLLTTVKRVGVVEDFRFCFEIISPRLHYVMCAQSATDMQEWIITIQNAIKEAFEQYKTLDCPVPGPLPPSLGRERKVKLPCLQIIPSNDQRNLKLCTNADLSHFNDLASVGDEDHIAPEPQSSTISESTQHISRKRVPFKLPFAFSNPLSDSMPTLSSYVDNSMLDCKRASIVEALRKLQDLSVSVTFSKEKTEPKLIDLDVGNNEDNCNANGDTFVDAGEEFNLTDMESKTLELSDDLWGRESDFLILHGMTLRDIVTLGFPQRIRFKSWLKIANARKSTTRKNTNYELIAENVDLQLKVLNREIPSDVDVFDREYKLGEVLYGQSKRIFVWRNEIENDLHRTSYDKYFMSEEGRSALRRVLLSYSLYNSSVGYCQSFSFIAAKLLLISNKDEEGTFLLLSTFVEELLPRDFFCEKMKGLLVDLRVFQMLFEEYMPQLSAHLDAMRTSKKIEPPLLDAFVSNWFSTLFVNLLPHKCLIRVWDALLCEGPLILFRVALVILNRLGSFFLNMSDTAEFYDLMQRICKNFQEFDVVTEDELIE
eukprot:Nk52_evm1s148 gene=Nk52_evmTU1s148